MIILIKDKIESIAHHALYATKFDGCTKLQPRQARSFAMKITLFPSSDSLWPIQSHARVTMDWYRRYSSL